jgi:hypothetical protein
MPTKHLTLIFLLFFISIRSLVAQELYEIKFTDSEETAYKGLLVIFNENKMYMRVSYKEEEIYKVVNVDYTSNHIQNADSSEYLVMIGANPRFITAAGKHPYHPDNLIFNDVSDVPLIADDPNKPDEAVEVDAFRVLKKADITEKYLREFYNTAESDFKALKKMFGIEPPIVATPNKNTVATLHLVVIANTMISDIGAGCAVDQRNLEGEFKGIADALGISLKKYIVNGEAFIKNNVLTTLNGLTVGKNDIVISVYRGHGFRWANQTDEWPFLDIRTSQYTRLSESTSISLSQIYTIIKSKGARLNLVLADCCNNAIGLSQNTNNNFLIMQNNNNYNIEKLRDLFINAKGNLLSCAASPGEYSWVNSANGGFYTVSFLQSLREEISYLRQDNADWRDLMDNTVKNAKAKTKSCSNCTPQNGKYFYGISGK